MLAHAQLSAEEERGLGKHQDQKSIWLQIEAIGRGHECANRQHQSESHQGRMSDARRTIIQQADPSERQEDRNLAHFQCCTPVVLDRNGSTGWRHVFDGGDDPIRRIKWKQPHPSQSLAIGLTIGFAHRDDAGDRCGP